MTRNAQWLASMAVVVGLAVPAIAEGQAIPRPRTGGSSSGSSGGGSSSGGGGGGGDVTPPPSSGTSRGSSGSGSSGSSSAGSASPRDGTFIGNLTSRRGSERSGGERRAAPEPGGLVGGHVGERTRGRTDSEVPRIASTLSDPTSVRLRGLQPVTGTAGPRPAGLQGGFVSFPLFGPWGRWYPWYGSGFGWNLGYVSFDPWRYGATCWVWGRYGMWYDPWGYSWNPYSYGGYPGGGGSYASAPRETTGSLRLRVNPSEAQVYLDGLLVGVVDDFNGLTDHLEAEGGKRVLEIRAEGYVTYTEEITVDVGKTKTIRVNLKKVD